MKQKYLDLKNSITEQYSRVTEQYSDYMNNINKVLKVMEESIPVSDEDSLETVIFKKYLELENVTKVAKEVNEMGYRVKTDTYVGHRKFCASEITEIIEGEALGVEDNLKEAVKWIQERNMNKMRRSNIWV